jgi:hypothetical protein
LAVVVALEEVVALVKSVADFVEAVKVLLSHLLFAYNI